MEKISNLGRHGDLSFRRANIKVKGKGHKSIVLALGEFTGHSHRLTADGNATVTYADNSSGEVEYFEVRGGTATLTHEEHKPITFVEGTYKVIREREYDYFLKSVKQVLD
jgi:hypothetical protein